jgi:hypothetical protein
MLNFSVPIAKIDLPSFLWLWRIAAWSMGLSLTAYLGLLCSGLWILGRDKLPPPPWLRTAHLTLGTLMLLLVLGLLAIGIVGTLGEHGSLGHSIHLIAGGTVVVLMLSSVLSATQIIAQRPWARRLHKIVNGLLGLALLWVLATGWVVVQPYLPNANRMQSAVTSSFFYL